ncbi:MAG TPA: CoA-binding protein [Anaerolineales bacterium]|nr:CoA-binding protein [Anaerolineales bacterium]HRF47628.1 CoA-binding protein [Anaerolineales bacterium]
MTTAADLAREFLAQKRIAVAGLSRSADSTAKGIIEKLEETGHTVFALNPNAAEIDGRVCYPEVGAIPGGVDGVVLVTSPVVSEQVVQQCIAAGVPRVWMHRSIGNSVSEAAVAAARAAGISVIAGGCPMMYQEPVDFGHACLRWWCGLTGRIQAN